MTEVLAALSWEPQIKGGLYVVLAVLILPGSCFLILSTDMGARLGFQIAMAGLLGFFVIIGSVWWVYGIGPVGRSPTWKPEAVITGDPAGGAASEVRGFPRSWEKLENTDPAVADAQPVADGYLEERELFKSSADYVLVGAYKKGGESYGPLGLNFRPLDVFHKAHYLMLQVQPVIPVPVVPGEAPPRPEADPSKPVVSTVLIRDLGSLRFNPAVFTLSSLLGFSLFVYVLHQRDKEAAARREQLR